MPLHIPRQIWLLQPFLLLLTQRLSPCLQRLIHARHTTEPNDRARNPLINPRKRHMAHLPPMLLRQLLHTADDLLVALGVPGREEVVVLVLRFALGADGLAEFLRRARKMPAAERRPGDQADAGGVAKCVHFALFFTVEEVVVVLGDVSTSLDLFRGKKDTHLHAHKLRPAVLLGARLHHGELPRPHAARADIVHFPHLDQIMQRLHRFLDRRVRIEAVDLQQIHILGIQTRQRLIHSREDGIAAQTTTVDVVLGLRNVLAVQNAADVGRLADVAVAFGEDDKFVARDVVFLDSFADDFFADAVGVDVGGVLGCGLAI